MRRSLPLLVLVLAACGPAAAPPEAPTHPTPPTRPGVESQPLASFCGGEATGRCPTLAEHLAELRAKDCPNVPTSHNKFEQRPCGALTRVDTDYGIVGYSRWFDAAGTLVAAAAHVYEHRTEVTYGTIPTCAAGPSVPVCAQ